MASRLFLKDTVSIHAEEWQSQQETRWDASAEILNNLAVTSSCLTRADVLEILRNGWSRYFVSRISKLQSRRLESVSGLFGMVETWFWCRWVSFGRKVQGLCHACHTGSAKSRKHGMLRLERCMHVILRVGLQMCFIANTWGTVLTVLLTVLTHLTGLTKGQRVPLVFYCFSFSTDTHRYFIMYLSCKDRPSHTVYIEWACVYLKMMP